jgi:hypothetical protein
MESARFLVAGAFDPHWDPHADEAAPIWNLSSLPNIGFRIDSKKTADASERIVTV